MTPSFKRLDHVPSKKFCDVDSNKKEATCRSLVTGGPSFVLHMHQNKAAPCRTSSMDREHMFDVPFNRLWYLLAVINIFFLQLKFTS